ncbi:hypothetical protein KIN20_000583 [Parelaphostrongylus tenuis]|uniref:Uncharacterized protein n=1 Tax=Parelaphostrongylus tenuis TaxID=148309 RepID=A0AAD5QG61_PARTN|nr:hypothetical protein KIN20_000583 [Parelaphostrongylus tenuis]
MNPNCDRRLAGRQALGKSSAQKIKPPELYVPEKTSSRGNTKGTYYNPSLLGPPPPDMVIAYGHLPSITSISEYQSNMPELKESRTFEECEPTEKLKLSSVRGKKAPLESPVRPHLSNLANIVHMEKISLATFLHNLF